MKKLICFSLWGDHEFYNYGALENAILAPEVYPGWTCRFYYSSTANPMVLEKLSQFHHVELVHVDETRDKVNNMFWRFFPAFFEGDVVFLSRDVDSRLNFREKAAVDEWLASDKDFHIMRDHMYHTVPILGGMWGCRRNILAPLSRHFQQWKHGPRNDQIFLATIVYPFVKPYSMIHASHYRIEPYVKDFPPSSSCHTRYVGSYERAAPRAFRALNEEPRLLETKYEHQKHM